MASERETWLFVAISIAFVAVAFFVVGSEPTTDVVRDSWHLQTLEGSLGRLEFGERGDDSLRVEILRLPEAGHNDATGEPETRPWTVNLTSRMIPIRKGRPYELTFRARADESRTIQALLNEDHGPWNNLGLRETSTLSTDWQPYRYVFTAVDNEPNASINFWLGDSTSAVEFDAVRFDALPAGVTSEPAGLARLWTSEDGSKHRIESTAPDGTEGAVRFLGPSLSLQAGQPVRVSLQVKSEPNRTATLRLVDPRPEPAREIFQMPLEMRAEWEAYRFEFPAPSDVPEVNLEIEAAAGAGAWEIQNLSVASP